MRMMTRHFITARRYGERGVAIQQVVCPSVCDAEVSWLQGWNSSNIISRSVSLACSAICLLSFNAECS